MALPDIAIEFYQYDPVLTHSKTLIYGALISSVEDTTTSSVKTQIAPGTAVYCSCYVAKDTYIEVSHDTPSVGETRRYSVAGGERRDLLLGPQETSTITIGYKEA